MLSLASVGGRFLPSGKSVSRRPLICLLQTNNNQTNVLAKIASAKEANKHEYILEPVDHYSDGNLSGLGFLGIDGEEESSGK